MTAYSVRLLACRSPPTHPVLAGSRRKWCCRPTRLLVCKSTRLQRAALFYTSTPFWTRMATFLQMWPCAPPFHKNPIGFFKGRKPLWWAWWLIRAGALVIVTIGFILLLNNFYVVHQKCSWCKYLSCININNWCEMEDLRFENTTAPTSSAASPAATGAQLLGGF